MVPSGGLVLRQGITENGRAGLAIQRRTYTDYWARWGPRDGVVGLGNQSLPRHFFHLLRSVKSSNDPISFSYLSSLLPAQYRPQHLRLPEIFGYRSEILPPLAEDTSKLIGISS